MKLSFRDRIAAAFFLLMLIPFLFFLGDSLIQQRQLTQREIQDYLVQQTRVAPQVLRDHQQYLADEARYISTDPNLNTYLQNPQLLSLLERQYLRQVKERSHLDWVVICDVDGNVLTDSQEDIPPIPVIHSSQRHTINTGIAFFHASQTGLPQPHLGIYATAPIFDQTRRHITGILFIGNTLDAGSGVIQSIRNMIRQAESVTSLQDGIDVSRLKKISDMIYLQPDEGRVFLALRNPEGVMVGWIQLEFSLDGITNASMRMKFRMMVTALVCLVCLALLSWVMSILMVAPLKKLREFVKTIRQDDVEAAVIDETVWGSDEIGQVARGFTDLSHWIRNFVEQEKEFSRKMQSVNEIRKQLSSILDIEELSTEIVRNIKEVVGADRVSLWLNDPPHQILRCAAMTDIDTSKLNVKKLAVRHGSGIVGKLAREWHKGRRQLQIKDIPRQVKFKGDIPPEYAGMRSLISIALSHVSRDEMVGVLNVARAEPSAFTKEDIDLISVLAGQAGVSMQNARVYSEVSTRERVKEELDIASDIQTRLLPSRRPDTLRLDIYGQMVPAREVGGDYFDYIERIPGIELGIVIGDVSGKGVSAGLIMMRARTVLHTLANQVISPKENLVLLNKYVYPDLGTGKFMTMLYLCWNGHTRKMTYSSAGHEHILVYRSSKRSCERIKSGGLAIGLTDDLSMLLKEKEIEIEPGDGIVLYTDGVTEARSEMGTLYELNRLQAAVGLHGENNARKLHHILMTELVRFMGTSEQFDDITLITMKFS
ncbi:MAG: GAF domain-containing protein [Gemmatimonadetes bacterium]|nr:MAG: GAF domain-containing protein [Gemmatimonadota bacterium]